MRPWRRDKADLLHRGVRRVVRGCRSLAPERDVDVVGRIAAADRGILAADLQAP